MANNSPQQSSQAGMKHSGRNTQGSINKVKNIEHGHPNMNADSTEATGVGRQALHAKSPQEVARHSRDIKPESDYTKGGVEGDGQDARRSRQKAIRFQEDLSNE